MAAKKKATTKKKATSATRKAAPRGKSKSVKEPMSKTALFTEIATSTGLHRKQVASVFDELRTLVEGHVKKGGPQLFTLPGLLKVKVIRKPATKARKGINPFTGEETVFKAKPARNVVKVQPLKALKEMAA